MTIDFISDLHLDKTRPEVNKYFINYLDNINDVNLRKRIPSPDFRVSGFLSSQCLCRRYDDLIYSPPHCNARAI